MSTSENEALVDRRADPIPSGKSSSRMPRRPLSWLKIILIILTLGIFLIAGGLYYVTTDSGFRMIVLPQVSKKLGIDIAAGRVEWSPLSTLKIQNLRIGSESAPLLKAKELSVVYNGREILNGNYQVESIQLESPVVTLIQNADGSLVDLPILSSSGSKKDSTPSASKSPSPPFRFKLSAIDIQNLDLTYRSPVREAKLHKLNLKAKDVGPSSSCSFEIQGDFEYQESVATQLSGVIKSLFNVTLNSDFIPTSAKGDLSVAELKGRISDQAADGLGAQVKLELEAPPNQKSVLKGAQMTVLKNGATLTTIQASGPMDLARKEADLNLRVGPIRSDILNLVFADRKIDFLDSSLSYEGKLVSTKNGELLKLDGKLEARPINLSSSQIPAGAWKSVELTGDHSLEIDLSRQQILVNKLNLDGSQQGNPLLKGTMDKPMLISWAGGAKSEVAVPDASFTFQVFPTDVLPYAPFLGLPSGWKIGSGALDANVKVVASNQGRKLEVDGHVSLNRISLSSSNLNLSDASIPFDGKASIEGLKNAEFTSLFVSVSEKGKPLIAASLTGKYDLSVKSGSGIAKFQVSLPDLLAVKGIPKVTLNSGTLASTLDWKLDAGGKVSCKADVQASNLDLFYDKIRYQQLSLAFRGNLEGKSPQFTFTDAVAAASLGGQTAGSWFGSLQFNSQTGNLTSNFKVRDWKLPILKPILSVYLPEREVQSIELTSEGEVKRENGSWIVKGTAGLKDLLVKVPSAPSLKPLNVTLEADLTSAPDGLVDLRSLALQFDPTPDAKNRIQISGKLKQTPTSSLTDLQVLCGTLDLSAYYDQLMPAPAAAPVTSPVPANSSSTVSVLSSASVPAMFVKDIKVNISAESVKIKDLVMKNVKIPYSQKDQTIDLKDAHLEINGAPVDATIKMLPGEGQPSFNLNATANAVPLGPLIDTFKPVYKGQAGGVLTTKFYGNGRGTSVGEWMESFDGVLELAIRQAHLEKMPGFQKALKQLGSYLQSPDITNSTVDDVDASGKISGGKIHTDNLHLKGSALETSLRGDLFFNQNINLEASFKIKRETMNKSAVLGPLLKAASSDTGDWIKTPLRAPITGTLDEPIVDKSKLLENTLINTGLNLLKELIKKKEEPKTPNDPSQPQQPAPINLLDLFKKKK
jgi:hypothetical protein